MFSFFRNMLDSVIQEECATCGGPCKYRKNEQKNFVCLAEGEGEKLICKECAKFFELIDKVKKELKRNE